jgi:hypothetical protein
MRAFWKISNVGVCVILFSLFAVGEEVTNKVETAVPSEQVIKSFVTSFNLKPDGKETVELKVNARQAVLPKRVMEIYKQKGTIPFAISVQLNKNIETEVGTETQSIFDGKATIVVADKDGKVVSHKTEDLSALCPS